MSRKLLNCKMIGILAILLVLFMAVGVAEEEKSDASGQWKYVLSNGGATIVRNVERSLSGEVVIPNELDGFPVTGIGDLFYLNERLTGVMIPESVTSIGDNAFENCSSLTSVNIPDSVTNLGINPFLRCFSLMDVNISSDHPAYVVIDSALCDKRLETLISYLGGNETTHYIIPEGVVNIGESAFHGLSFLTGVTIPNSVTSIGKKAFLDCKITEVMVPDSVTNIGDRAFAGCRSLTNVIIPTSVINIGTNIFDGSNDVTLTVSRGSVAEQYAKENDIPYVIMPEARPETASEAPMADDEAFIPIGGNTFTFSSGAGGWSTEVTISEDGSFTGHFHDWDMGDTGDDYPEGTRYECLFTGVFVVVGKIDPFTYELRLTALNAKEDAGAERIEDGVRVISAGAYGLENGDVFMLYCPGRATADLPENFLDWVRMPNAWEEVPDALPFYGLYNKEEEFGFSRMRNGNTLSPCSMCAAYSAKASDKEE